MKSPRVLIVNSKLFIGFVLSSLFVILYSLFVILASPAYAGNCNFSVNPTDVAPHGSFSVSVSNTQPDVEYVIFYDQSPYRTIWNSDGNTYTTTVSLDELFGSESPQSSNGSFLVWSSTTVAESPGGPGETCEPANGVLVRVDPSLYATPYASPYGTPYSSPYSTPYATPYTYPTPPYATPYSYPTPPYSTPPYAAPYATPYSYPTPYGTPYASPYSYPTPPYGTPYVTPSDTSGFDEFAFGTDKPATSSCTVGSEKSFSIWACFHPAKLFSDTDPSVNAGEEARGFGRLASDVLLILVSVAASLSIIFVVISGIKFVTSGGDPKNLASARNTITYAIIGIAVTILAFVILRVVQFFLTGAAQSPVI